MEREDFYRPRYHFRPAHHWMNDPNGPIWFEGEYHLFYQYNPYGDTWGTIHWGHAVSKDLIHWTEKEIALAPQLAEGEVHCYSGCTFLKNDIPIIYYTSVGTGERGPEEGALQRYAYSLDGMQTWIRPSDVVLSSEVHEGAGDALHIAMWRDPFVFQEEDGYYMLLSGTRLPQKARKPEDLKLGKGVIALYFSKDALEWAFKSILVESEEFWLLECPNLITFNREDLLLYSPMDSVRYQVGRLDRKSGKFMSKKQGSFDYSILKKGFYAPNTYLNVPDRRKIVVGWISEADRSASVETEGWAGMLSMPREVGLAEDGSPRMKPVEEAKNLRKAVEYQLFSDLEIDTALAKGRSLEICLELTDITQESEFELHLLESQDKREFTSVCFDGKTSRLSIIRDSASLMQGCGKEKLEAFIGRSESLKLNLFLDCSVVELYVNDSFTMTVRVYPSLVDSEGITVKCCSGLGVAKFTVWRLAL